MSSPENSAIPDEEVAYHARTCDAVRRELALCAERLGAPDAYGDSGFSSSVLKARIVKDAGARQESLIKAAPEPYHARVDFLEYGAPEPEPLYFGLTYIDDPEQQLVLDWRCPAGALYYARSSGAAQYVAPMGKITGTILRRREFVLDAERIQQMDEIGDAISLERLARAMESRAATGAMQQAVRTLDPEQDALIRATAPVLLLQGPAGSGKTVVALHRAAYLLFAGRHRTGKELTTKNLMVLSPNRLFARYIADLLPQLHEEPAEQLIFDDFLRSRLRACPGITRADIVFEPRTELLAFLADQRGTPEASGRRRRFRAKHHRELTWKLRAFVAAEANASLETLSASLPERVDFDGHVLFERDTAIKSLRRGLSSLKGALRGTPGWVTQLEVARHESLARLDSLLDEERRQLRLRETLARRQTRLDQDIESRRREVNAFAQSRERVASGWDRVVNPLRSRSLWTLYTSFWNGLAGDATLGDTARETLSALRDADGRRAFYDDLAPMLLLETYFRGVAIFDEIFHVILDEAQDYTPLHIELLRAFVPRECGMTLVGDIRQSIEESLGFSDWDEVAGQFYTPPQRAFLTRTYRSTPPIVALSSRLFSPSLPVDALPRDGETPTLWQTDDVAETVAAIIDDELARGAQSIGVLCAAPVRCRALAARLGGRARLIDRDIDTPPSGVIVLPLFLAKGLEFESVIIADADAATYAGDAERNGLYTACTRALHRLYLVTQAAPSPLLPVSETLLARRAAVA